MRRTIAMLHSSISSPLKGHQSRTVTQAMSLNDLPPELTARVILYLALLETPDLRSIRMCIVQPAVRNREVFVLYPGSQV
jgi:hypothetical protein